MQDPVLKCLHENHYSKQIIGVCVNSDCQKIRPYCQQCLKCYLHSEHLHDLQDFTDFYNYVQEGLNTYNKLQNLAEELQSIAKLITIIINQLSFNPKINLKDMSIIAINNLINKIIRVKEVDLTLKNNLELAVVPLQKIKQDFKELLQKNSIKCNKNNIAEQQLIREQPNQKTQQKSKKQKKTEKECIKHSQGIIKRNNLQVIQGQQQTKQEDMKHQIVCIKPSKSKEEKKQQQQQQIIHNQGKYQFSNIYKNRAINVIQSENSAEGFGFCVCDQAIAKSGTTIIAFRILKCDWRIHIGVCNRDMLIESKYDPNLANIGHGTYLINNQGDIFSTIDQENNDKSKSFKFYNKNIITIEIDIEQQQITWIKKQPNETFILKIDNQKELYPCVKLWGSSKVELLNPIILQ